MLVKAPPHPHSTLFSRDRLSAISESLPAQQAVRICLSLPPIAESTGLCSNVQRFTWATVF